MSFAISRNSSNESTFIVGEFNSGIQVNDGGSIALGNSSNITNGKCITTTLLSSEAILENQLVKIINVGGIAKVAIVEITDDRNVSIIGSAVSATTATDQNIDVCIGGIFKCIVENGLTITTGDDIGMSFVNNGRVNNIDNSISFGVALTSGTGDVGGTVTISVIFTSNVNKVMENNKGGESIAIGVNAGNNTQGSGAVAIGVNTGNNTQGSGAVAIGVNAGEITQQSHSVGIGTFAGNDDQGASSVAIGINAARRRQGTDSVAVGVDSGNIDQGNGSIAIGIQAGRDNQGDNCIAIGAYTAISNQVDNTIAIGDSAIPNINFPLAFGSQVITNSTAFAGTGLLPIPANCTAVLPIKIGAVEYLLPLFIP
jgi:hypothetical protein